MKVKSLFNFIIILILIKVIKHYFFPKFYVQINKLTLKYLNCKFLKIFNILNFCFFEIKKNNFKGILKLTLISFIFTDITNIT